MFKSISDSSPKTNLGKTSAGLYREAMNRARKYEGGKEFNKWRKKFIKDGDSSKIATERAIEETNARILEDYFGGKAIDRSMYQKIKDWLKRAYTALKTTFKEVDKLSDDELYTLLSGKMAKRNFKDIP